MADFDIAVIGAGAAGLSIAAGAAQLGQRVALIARAERGETGREWMHTGVPGTALLAVSRAMRLVRSAGRFGIAVTPPQIAWDTVRAHLRGVAGAIARDNSAARYRALGVTVLTGQARFADPDSLIVDGRRLTARRIVVAAGGRTAPPPVPGLKTERYWTGDSLLDLDERPDHLLILGGGAIGLEMADAFSGLGCRVTLVEAQRIASGEDPELADGLRQALLARGVTIREGAAVQSVLPGPELVLADGSRLSGSHLLVAAGRRPDLEDLDLPRGHVQAGPGGIATDAGLRSISNRRVYAAGDVADPVSVGRSVFAHVAGYHATLLLRRMLFRLPVRLDYAALPRVTATDPELAQTGLTEADARSRGLDVRILRWSLADNDRTLAERDGQGLVKLVLHGKRLVGAGILAPHAGEMISLYSLAVSQRLPVSALAGLIVPYPTRTEAGQRAAGSFYTPLLVSKRTRRLVGLLSRLP